MRRVLIALFLLFAFLFAFFPQRWFRSLRMTLLSFFRPAQSLAQQVDGSTLGAEPAAPPYGSAGADDRRIETLQRENAELRESLIRIHTQQVDLARKLQAVTSLVQHGFRKVPRIIQAGIIVTGDASDWHSTLLLDRGSRDGIREGQPVVWGRHLVGKVVEVGPVLSRVRTIVDPGFRMRAMAAHPPSETSPGSSPPSAEPPSDRLLGLLEGDGTGGCELMWILAEERVGQGDVVVTVEEDRGRWPGGLVAGTIVEASTRHGPYYRIRVQPGVNLGLLSGIFVLDLE